MLAIDEDAVACDLAETYGVLDLYELKPITAATLAIGLREDSRIMKKLSGSKLDTLTLISIGILDRLNMLMWMQTEDARKKRNKPKSILDMILKTKEKVTAFDTVEAFEAEKQRILSNG